MKKIVILGAGISGIGAGYKFSQDKNNKVILFEKNSSWGGLCDNFTIDGFRFDKFVHFSFSDNQEVRELFEKGSESIKHIPNPSNYYKGTWLKHPAQNNLYPLNNEEKEKILFSFKNRENKDIDEIKNYEEWLKVQYGDYFAETFPMKYTRKYWGVEAKELETKWIGSRMYKPTLEEVEEGMKTQETPLTYYAKEMRYPLTGGYKSYLNYLVKNLDIRLNHEVKEIDTKNKIIYFKNNMQETYDELISSIPLSEMHKLIKNIPESIVKEIKKLRWTSGYIVSLGLKTQKIPPYLWFYVYDEDIPFARVYSPSHKSSDNCPIGCSSLQLEIYFENREKNKFSERELLEKSIQKLVEMNIIEKEDILVQDIRFEKYANVIFDFNIYGTRRKIREYLNELGIVTIGRFGEWDYFWSDQSLMSGLKSKEKNLKILIATHKKYNFPKDEYYLPIHVGKKIRDDIGYLGDDTGENISAKVGYYSELTALYWAWKNLEYEYIGLVHYRRYFGDNSIKEKNKYKKIIKGEEIVKIIKKNPTKVILTKARNYYIETLYSHFENTMYIEFLDKTEEIIKKEYIEYYQYFLKIKTRKKAHMFNMLIMEKEILGMYCEWLFSILFKLEKKIDLNKYTAFHQRTIGRVGELLLDIWIEKNKLRYLELPIIEIEKTNWIKKGGSFLLAKIIKKKYDESF